MERSALISQALELDGKVQRFIRRHTFQTWMELNVTVPQLKTLFFVHNREGTNPGKLASALGVTPSNVTGIVDRLVEQDLLARAASQADRRALVLRTTDRGEAVLAGLREWRASTLREIFSGMSSDDLDLLVRGLSAMAATVRRQEEMNRNGHDSSGESD